MPILTVVQNGILPPNLRSGLVAHTFNELSRTGPRPILPFLYVTMLHRIVMNVINASLKMAVGFNTAVQRVVPDLILDSFVSLLESHPAIVVHLRVQEFYQTVKPD